MKPAIQLASGRFFCFEDATEADIQIGDIAASLSKLCRYTGHCREFYSVAQHSVMVSEIVPPEHALLGLLHDATEAYMNDLSRPVKVRNPAYIEQEHALWAIIAQRFSVPEKMPACIKRADNIALLTERRDLMPPPDPLWEAQWRMGIPTDLEPLPERITPWSPEMARLKFLARFLRLDSCFAPARCGCLTCNSARVNARI